MIYFLSFGLCFWRPTYKYWPFLVSKQSYGTKCATYQEQTTHEGYKPHSITPHRGFYKLICIKCWIFIIQIYHYNCSRKATLWPRLSSVNTILSFCAPTFLLLLSVASFSNGNAHLQFFFNSLTQQHYR